MDGAVICDVNGLLTCFVYTASGQQKSIQGAAEYGVDKGLSTSR